MPSLILQVNVKVDVKELSMALAQLGSKLLDKPLNYMAVSITYNEGLSFGGTFDPAFLLNLYSLGNIDPKKNDEYSQVLFDFLLARLGIPGDRGYIVFNDPTNSYMGHAGTTFGTIFGTK